MKSGSTHTMSEGSSSPKRARLDFDDNLKDDHFDKYKNRDQDDQGSYTHTRRKRAEPDDDDYKESDELKNKNVTVDGARREHTLVMRLTNKEQELQECMNQIQEMKQAQTQNTAQLRSMLLDPAINLVFQRMAREMDEHKEKLKQKQNELSAWKFTADSQTGMRLMAKCRMLLQENGELGKMISSGRTARLEGEISLQKALVTEMKKNQKELDEFVGELEEDVESMQGMILMLQQQLKEAREQIGHLQQENQQLRTSQIPAEPGGSMANSAPQAPSSDATPLSASTSLAKSSATPLTHQSSLISGGSSYDRPETSSLKALPTRCAANDAIAVSASLMSDLPETASLMCDSNSLSPPAFKVTPDSGMQTQEEDEVSVDAADLPSQGSSHSAPQIDPKIAAVGSETEMDAQSPNPLPSLQGSKDVDHNSLTPELLHNSEKISNCLDVVSNADHENVRTSPPPDTSGDVLRTDSPSTVSPQNANGKLGERTSTPPSTPSVSEDLTLEKSDNGDKSLLTRTSNSSHVVSDQEMRTMVNNGDSDEIDTVSKHSECGATAENAEMDVECPLQMGLTNGSSAQC